ncbi:MAG: HAMP domain-containing histidine kinase [Lachnospiraceae bacterium]|nr:HAMP domain-containing histidine kinase [Lachnospiraceae bacterium]
MSIRTKILIAFLAVVLLPPLLIAVSFVSIGTYQLKELSQDLGLSEEEAAVVIGQPEIMLKPSGNALHRSGRTQDIIQRIKLTAMQMMLSQLAILIATGILIIYWIHTSLLNPIRQLTEATQQIKEGNLDYEVTVPETKDELMILCENFNDMRARLKESSEVKLENETANRELISNITHDLKTPVTSIKGYAEGILDGVADTPEKLDKYVHTIYNKANDMDRLINELTFYSGIDANRIPYSFAKINLSDYFQDCTDDISMDLEAERIRLEYTNEIPSDTLVIADPVQLKKVINNIVGNSIKYMDKEDGLLSIRLKDAGDSVRIELSDNGIGISSRDLPYIFDRFYRTDSSRNSSKGGSGIGLSIVKKIVEDQGGRIWATSVQGEGTTMLIEFRKYTEPGNKDLGSTDGG